MTTTIERHETDSRVAEFFGDHAGLSSDDVWDEVVHGSFAVLSYVTPSGEPRSSGVMYEAIGERLYIAVESDGWKAKHIARNGHAAVTVPVRRGGMLTLVAPIPPATISFHGRAAVHPANSPEARPILAKLKALLPEERRTTASIIEVVPEGAFVTYGIGVPLMKMRDTDASRARVPVDQGMF